MKYLGLLCALALLSGCATYKGDEDLIFVEADTNDPVESFDFANDVCKKLDRTPIKANAVIAHRDRYQCIKKTLDF
ncbi:hypothetical protein [Flexibacterium corallicola]|uniref:hypothetical protein n=1 Tax=Flexibacterium corallicola TaxID=3037259 RepID=UPI00286EE0B3|nr:hypothetical protein [Pseudovibrio sp. M1P-2-3]